MQTKNLMPVLAIIVVMCAAGCGQSKEAEDVAAIRATLDKQEAQKEADKAADRERLRVMREKAERDYQATLKTSEKK
jgi:tryptophan 2,3-dioxygenase